MRGTPNDAYLLAVRRLDRQDAHLLQWELPDGFDGCRVVIADAPLLKTGPRKGRPNWRQKTNTTQLFLTHDEIYAHRVERLSARGWCIACEGEARIWSGWSETDGHRYKPCTTCHGTGLLAESSTQ